MGLTTRIRLAKLQLITDIRTSQGDWADFVASVFDGGVDLLQVREPHATAEQLMAALKVARAIAFDRKKAIAVAGNPGVAAQFGADFLHLGAADADVSSLRKGLPEASIVGRSVHNKSALDKALADNGVGYLYVGPVFDTRPNDGLGAPGVELVKQAAAAAPQTDPASKPWFAVGGISIDNLSQVLDAGAYRVAVSAAITRAANPEAAAQALSDKLHAAWDAQPAMETVAMKAFGTPGSSTFIAHDPR